MKKRLLAILLCVAMAASLLTVGAMADDGVLSGQISDNISYTLDTSTGTLSIGGEGEIPYPLDSSTLPYAQYMDSITKIVIEDGVSNYSSDLIPFGFYTSNIVKEVYLGADARDGLYGLSHLEQLEKIVVSENNENFFSSDGVLYELLDDGTYNLFVYPFNKQDTQYKVLEGTSTISGGEGYGFFDNDFITTVILPDTVKSIEGHAFAECASLSSVNIPSGVETLSAEAFWYCYHLSEIHIPASVTSCKGHVMGDWSASQEMAHTSVYFYGNAPADFDGAITTPHVRNGYKMTIYYPANATGWDEAIDWYFEKYDNGVYPSPILQDYVTFKEWNPNQTTPQIVELSPANGATISETATTYFRVTYDTPIAATSTTSAWSFPELDFSNGTIEIRRASDDALIYSVEADPYINELYDIEGTYSGDVKVENGNTLLIQPFNVHTLFDSGEEYYVTIPSGFVAFANGVTNDAIEKGEWTFTAYDSDRNFILGEDNNSYIHSRRSGGGFEGTNDYSFKNKDILNYLRDGKDFITWLNITLATWDTVLNSWNGCCYGVAATMALVYNEVYDVSDINESNAKTYYEMPWPCEDDKLHDIINYYQVTQSFGGKVLTAYANSPNEGDVLEKLIELLGDNPNEAILFAYHYINEHGKTAGHTILALDYTITETGNYSVRLYDENTIGRNNSLGEFVYMEISDDFSEYMLVDGNGETLCPETCVNLSLVETENIPALPSMLNNYSASSSSTSTGDDSATIVVSFVDGIQLTNEKGETLYAGEKGIPTGSMQIIDMTPIIYGPEDTSNEWLLKVAPFEDLYIESSGETVDIWYASNERGYSIIGDNLSGAIISVDKGIELTPSSGSTANVQLGLASADVGNALVDITASVTEHSTVELQADGRSSFVSLDGGIDNINATLLTSDGDKRLESTYSDNSTHIDIDVDGVDMPNWPAIDAPVGQGPSTEPDEPSAALPFADVAASAWYYDAVSYVYANGLMDGVSAVSFNPDGAMTRAMVWAILARIDGETVTGADWAAEAREWAVAAGVSDGTDPDGYVTREQLVTMLYRYAGEPAASGSLSGWADAARVSDWAEGAMVWAVGEGVITGASATELNPAGSATRAECAAILMRYVEL